MNTQKRRLLLSCWLAALGTIILQPGCAEPKPVTDSEANSPESIESESSGALTFERMSPLVEAYRDIENVLELNHDEIQRIESVREKHKTIFETWYENQGAENKKLEKKFFAAAKARDLAAMQTMKSNGERAKMDEFKKQERDLQVEFAADLIAAVPEDKLATWKAHRIAVLLLDFLHPLQLTDDQVSAIHQQAPQIIATLPRKEQSNWQGYGTQKLEKRFEQNILQQDQQASFDTLKSQNKMRMLRWNNVTSLR